MSKKNLVIMDDTNNAENEEIFVVGENSNLESTDTHPIKPSRSESISATNNDEAIITSQFSKPIVDNSSGNGQTVNVVYIETTPDIEPLEQSGVGMSTIDEKKNLRKVTLKKLRDQSLGLLKQNVEMQNMFKDYNQEQDATINTLERLVLKVEKLNVTFTQIKSLINTFNQVETNIYKSLTRNGFKMVQLLANIRKRLEQESNNLLLFQVNLTEFDTNLKNFLQKNIKIQMETDEISIEYLTKRKRVASLNRHYYLQDFELITDDEVLMMKEEIDLTDKILNNAIQNICLIIRRFTIDKDMMINLEKSLTKFEREMLHDSKRFKIWLHFESDVINQMTKYNGEFTSNNNDFNELIENCLGLLTKYPIVELKRLERMLIPLLRGIIEMLKSNDLRSNLSDFNWDNKRESLLDDSFHRFHDDDTFEALPKKQKLDPELVSDNIL